MGVSITGQANVFLLCLLDGVATGLLFDVLRIIRRQTKAGVVLTNIIDMLFWIFATILSSLWLYTVNDGQLRWYEFVAICLGAGLYFITISPILLRVVTFFVNILKKILLITLKILLYPVMFVCRLFKRTCIFIFIPVGKIFRSVKCFFKNRFFSCKKALCELKKRAKKV